MTTIKLNSTGDDVKALQRLLHLTPVDGIFGKNTQAALIAFQRANGLTPDGICGPRTWSLLAQQAAQPTHEDITIVKTPLSVHITKKEGRAIRYLAIHYTASRTSAGGQARATRRTFEVREASTDFVVDDREIVQMNPDPLRYYCWAVGDAKNPYTGGGQLKGKALNSNTISIEICSNLRPDASPSAANHPGWYFTPSAIDNAVRLARYLMQKYDIPLSRVVRHYDITGKLCPGVKGWNTFNLYDEQGQKTKTHNTDEAWRDFLSRLE